MRIAVCVKQVPNPETPISVFRVDEAMRRLVLPPGQPLVMSPFDEQAVEAALRIRDSSGSGRIAALTLGPESARNVLKHALAMGADDGVLVTDPTLDDADGYTTVLALEAALRKLNGFDLVLAGRQAADWDSGMVGAGLAERLGWPVVTLAAEVRAVEGAVRVKRVLEDGMETVEAPLPAVVTISNELGAPRKPTLRETMKAARKPVVQWSAADLGLDPGCVAAARERRVRERLYIPVREGRCEMISGDTPGALAAALAQRLHEARLL
jgi:electron transfer flavoprotein beta subunit